MSKAVNGGPGGSGCPERNGTAAAVSKDAARPKGKGRASAPAVGDWTPAWWVDDNQELAAYWPPSAAARSSARAPPSIASIE